MEFCSEKKRNVLVFQLFHYEQDNRVIAENSFLFTVYNSVSYYTCKIFFQRVLLDYKAEHEDFALQDSIIARIWFIIFDLFVKNLRVCARKKGCSR